MCEVRCMHTIFCSTETSFKCSVHAFLSLSVAYTSYYAFISSSLYHTCVLSGPCFRDCIVVDSKQEHIFEGKVALFPV